MKKRILAYAVAMFSLSATMVSADDYCCDYQYDDCCWQSYLDGLYIGGNLGAGTHVARRHDDDGFFGYNSGWATSDTAFLGGVHIGYDWERCNNAVYGVIVDWNATNLDRRHYYDPNGSNYSFRSEIDWYTTIRAKAGINLCDTQFYLTAGAAVADFDNKWTNGTGTYSSSKTRWGWTGGVGTSYTFCRNWKVGAEVLFMQFEDHHRTINDGSNDYTFTHNDTVWTAQLLISYDLGALCRGCW